MSRGTIELRFAPRWELVRPARELLLHFFSLAVGDAEIAGQAALAANELMENAVKYSAGGDALHALDTLDTLIKAVVEEDGAIVITIENTARREELASLAAELAAAARAPDPLDHYRRKMEEASTRDDGRSRLGFARIRWEARMELELEAHDDFVRVVARRGPRS
jgi:hypothetical protein